MRIVILGGSFNPVHIGHLVMAEYVRDEFGYDLALLVPSALPPHKELDADPGAGHRLAMLELAAGGDDSIAIDDCELRRGGLSYTVDTLREVVERYRPEGKPGLIIGDDLAGDFRSWREPERILELADLVIARRSVAAASVPDFPHRAASNPRIEVSSSLVRRRIAEGRAFGRFLDPRVRGYIVAKGLYGYGR